MYYFTLIIYIVALTLFFSIDFWYPPPLYAEENLEEVYQSMGGLGGICLSHKRMWGHKPCKIFGKLHSVRLPLKYSPDIH